MSESPTLNDLRALSTALPASERLSGAEAADVLSAVVAVGHYGQDLLDAAQNGADSVLQFFHDHAVTKAQEAGHDEPQRGAVTQTAEAPQVQSGAPGTIDYAKLAEAIVAAQRADVTQPEAPAPATESVTPTDPTGATAQPQTEPSA